MTRRFDASSSSSKRERESTKDKKERRLEKASLVVLGETTGR
jgi:hypothetical protein|tara:strand:- start:300 stop:425 length:126 start_codon:yes stop_codon:yes gene_type:complete